MTSRHVVAAVLVTSLLALAVAGGVLWTGPPHPAPALPSSVLSPAPGAGLVAANSPLAATLWIGPENLDQGQSIAVETNATGGTSPYTYHYNGMPAGCSTNEGQSFDCTPSATGMFSVNVTVTDVNYNVTYTNLVGLTVNAPMQVSLQVNPNEVSEGSSVSVQTTVSQGSGGYQYAYMGLPSGCTPGNQQSFTCNPSSSGGYSVSVTVTDSDGAQVTSNTQNLQVNSAGSGSPGGGNNSSNPFSGLLNGFKGILSIVLIFGIIGFITWILLIVGVWIIAIVLLRRLPKRGATAPVAAPTVKCASCSAMIPAGTKFCPECGAGTAPKTS